MVHDDSADFEALEGLHDTAGILCIDCRLQAVTAVIGKVQRFLEIRERRDWQHGTEDFVLESRRASAYAGKDCGRVELAIPFAAGEQFGSVLQSLRDLRLDALRGFFRNQRADIGVFRQRIAQLQGARLGDKRLDEPVLNGLIDQHALDRTADLAVSAGEAPGDQIGGDADRIGVFAHDRRVIAAQLKMDFL